MLPDHLICIQDLLQKEAVEKLIGYGLSLPSATHFFRMKTHETDLPTYETPPQTEIRLPRSHENHERAKSDQPPPQSRPKGPLQIGLSVPPSRRTFSKKDRLLKRREYKRLSREGRRLVGVRICIDCAKSSGSTRLGITASTHYGNAPERNRFKRLVREAFRLSRHRIPSDVDLNVIPRKLAKTATLADIKAEFFNLLLTRDQKR
jgi:ribonuclease P protein component